MSVPITRYGNCSSVGKSTCFAPQPGSNGPIHPRNKLEVGRRVALAALALSSDPVVAKAAAVHSGPIFESCVVQPSTATTSPKADGGGGALVSDCHMCLCTDFDLDEIAL